MRIKHVFISYCHDNTEEVGQLYDKLKAAGANPWWNCDIRPGENRKLIIKKAIQESFAFILCLSKESEKKNQTEIYSEIRDAIAKYRSHVPWDVFLIPVRLSECEIPFLEIDDTTMLSDINHVDLFPLSEPNESRFREEGLKKLVDALRNSPDYPKIEEINSFLPDKSEDPISIKKSKSESSKGTSKKKHWKVWGGIVMVALVAVWYYVQISIQEEKKQPQILYSQSKDLLSATLSAKSANLGPAVKSLPYPDPVKPLSKKTKKIAKNRKFIAFNNKTVLDTETGLMWADKDNDEPINWHDAKAYCENYRAGGYDDWRMPTIEELKGLYDKNITSSNGAYHITELIHLTSCCPWSSEISEDGSRAFSFVFSDGYGDWFNPDRRRVLPVRRQQRSSPSVIIGPSR